MYLLSLVYHYSHHLGTDIYIILEVIVSLLQHVKEIPLLTNIVILIHFNPFNRGRKWKLSTLCWVLVMFLILKWISENKFKYLIVNMLSSFSVGWFIFTNISVCFRSELSAGALSFYSSTRKTCTDCKGRNTNILWFQLQDNNLLAIKANCNYIH